jgi:PIN domain nuclease of toxin-antitoxin system
MNASRYLLDTHLVYWWMTNDAALGKAARQLISEADIAVSVVSLWELIIKNRKGKLSLPEAPLAQSLEAQGFAVLPARGDHIESSRGIRLNHGDPFDRLLVATARAEGCIFLTRDRAILSAGLAYVLAA